MIRPMRRGTHGPDGPPDILYHATTRERSARAAELGLLEIARQQPIFLSTSEEQAWRVAHRQWGDPAVLYVDAARARRDGFVFSQVRHGLWRVGALPARHVLNLHPAFAEQASAGGVLFWEGPEGPELALIRVSRRPGCTWEVAKGKIEPGETPPQAAMREMREEMGLASGQNLEIVLALGAVRYGFQTPSGEPRLKTLHLYLVQTGDRVAEFTPAAPENIQEVAWFSPREAARRVHHRSLRPLMEELCRRLESPRPEQTDPG